MKPREIIATVVGDGGRARGRIVDLALVDVDIVPNPSLARGLLADELGGWCKVLLDEFGPDDEGDLDRDGLATFNADERRAARSDPGPFTMLRPDAALVRVLAKVDADEARTARVRRVEAALAPGSRWNLWADVEAPRGLVLLAGALWRRKVEPRWRQGVDRPPAIVRGILHDRLRPLLSRARLEGDDVLDGKGTKIASVIASVEPALVRDVLARGVACFRTTIAHKLIRFLALEAHAATVRGDTRADVVHVEGGLVGLADLLGHGETKARDVLRDILAAGRALDLSAPGLEVHGLWHANTIGKAAPGHRAVLEIVLNERVFVPGTARDMKAAGDSRPARRARLLVPVLQNDPPHRVRNTREWAPAWSVALGVLVRLVDAAGDLATGGGALLDAKAWGMLVDEAGLDRSRVGVVRDVLLEGDGTAPRMLVRAGADRFDLADTHAAERAFIVSRVRRSPKGD